MSFSLFSSNKDIVVNDMKKDTMLSEPFIFKPKNVFIPIVDENNNLLSNLLKLKTKVKKGSVIGRDKNGFPYFSSVSGTIKSIVEIPFSDFKTYKCYKIENNKLDEYDLSKPVLNYKDVSKQEILDLIKESGVINYSNDGLPTYLSFNLDMKIKTLLINAVESNPYISSDVSCLINNISYLFHILPFMQKLLSFDKAILCLNKNNIQLSKKILSSKLIYNDNLLDIHLIDNSLLAENDKFLVRKVCKTKYDISPIEKGIFVANIYTLSMLGRFFLEGKRPDIRCYTLNGEINKPCNVISPFGTRAKSLIDNCGLGIKNKKNLGYFSYNVLSNFSYPDLDFVLNMNSKGVVVKELLTRHADNCINCGKCVDTCPCDLQPNKIYKSFNYHDMKSLNKLNTDKCIYCGICNYVCPSNINLVEAVYKSNKKMLEVKNGSTTD